MAILGALILSLATGNPIFAAVDCPSEFVRVRPDLADPADACRSMQRALAFPEGMESYFRLSETLPDLPHTEAIRAIRDFRRMDRLEEGMNCGIMIGLMGSGLTGSEIADHCRDKVAQDRGRETVSCFSQVLVFAKHLKGGKVQDLCDRLYDYGLRDVIYRSVMVECVSEETHPERKPKPRSIRSAWRACLRR